jgi:hypothetical protein
MDENLNWPRTELGYSKNSKDYLILIIGSNNGQSAAKSYRYFMNKFIMTL